MNLRVFVFSWALSTGAPFSLMLPLSPREIDVVIAIGKAIIL